MPPLSGKAGPYLRGRGCQISSGNHNGYEYVLPMTTSHPIKFLRFALKKGRKNSTFSILLKENPMFNIFFNRINTVSFAPLEILLVWGGHGCREVRIGLLVFLAQNLQLIIKSNQFNSLLN